VPRTLTWINLGFLFVVSLAIVQLYFILSPRLRGTRAQQRSGGPDG
jgi:hypothetical protein